MLVDQLPELDARRKRATSVGLSAPITTADADGWPRLEIEASFVPPPGLDLAVSHGWRIALASPNGSIIEYLGPSAGGSSRRVRVCGLYAVIVYTAIPKFAERAEPTHPGHSHADAQSHGARAISPSTRFS